MPKKQIIPPEIQTEVQNLIDKFNRVNLKESSSLLNAFFPSRKKRGYSARFICNAGASTTESTPTISGAGESTEVF